MPKIDANVMLRYVLNDHAELSPKAKEIIDQQIVEIPIEVLCEVIFVLTGHYKIDRQSVSAGLQRFFEQTKCILPHRKAVLRGLEYFGQNTIDFVDCVLAGYSEVEKDKIFTFDNKLQKLMDKGNLTPSSS
jgi:predicted nucleic-acid-binding protein